MILNTPKIGIIITTFERNKLLYKCVASLIKNWQDNFELIIVDQGNYSSEKCKWILDNRLLDSYYHVPFNSGLSFCRNYGVQRAKHKQCEYILLGSDSFLFNSSIKKLNFLIKHDLFNYDILGFDLKNCVCGWEAKLDLIKEQHFELDFIDKKKEDNLLHENKVYIWECDITRNFFLVKINSLFNVKWDENLKLREHEEWFYRYKLANYKTGWTHYIHAKKETERPSNYKVFRDKNMREGLDYLLKKYKIKRWITYKNFERAKLDV